MRVVPQTDLHIQTLKKLEADFPDVSFNVKCITDYCMKIALYFSQWSYPLMVNGQTTTDN